MNEPKKKKKKKKKKKNHNILSLSLLEGSLGLVDQEEQGDDAEEHTQRKVDPHAHPVVVGEGETQGLQSCVAVGNRAHLQDPRWRGHWHKLAVSAGKRHVVQLVGDEGLKAPLEERDVLNPREPVPNVVELGEEASEQHEGNDGNWSYGDGHFSVGQHAAEQETKGSGAHHQREHSQ